MLKLWFQDWIIYIQVLKYELSPGHSGLPRQLIRYYVAQALALHPGATAPPSAGGSNIVVAILWKAPISSNRQKLSPTINSSSLRVIWLLRRMLSLTEMQDVEVAGIYSVLPLTPCLLRILNMRLEM
ncbi:uncharacterized protein [Lolium perenne]|uniref:uncharacterized protein isoform X1 n=1 Tax=Lolium perenne TaxID=4522 RepID=UPI0021F50B92|nr:uncharacterized protein LOC127317100 isoform X2 [Lolium perenne]